MDRIYDGDVNSYLQLVERTRDLYARQAAVQQAALQHSASNRLNDLFGESAVTSFFRRNREHRQHCNSLAAVLTAYGGPSTCISSDDLSRAATLSNSDHFGIRFTPELMTQLQALRFRNYPSSTLLNSGGFGVNGLHSAIGHDSVSKSRIPSLAIYNDNILSSASLASIFGRKSLPKDELIQSMLDNHTDPLRSSFLTASFFDQGSVVGSAATSREAPQPLYAIDPYKRKKFKFNRSRLKKPKDMPKRPLSAYNFFFKDTRAKILASIPEPSGSRLNNDDDNNATQADDDNDDETATDDGKRTSKISKKPHGKIGFEDLAKAIGQQWKSTSPLVVQQYKELAEEDMKRYKGEMSIYQHRSRSKKKLKVAEDESSVALAEGDMPAKVNSVDSVAKDAPHAIERASTSNPLDDV